MCTLRNSGSVLATFYTGIGDAILHAPILAALRTAFGSRLIIPELAGMELLRRAPQLRGIRTVPSHFRKLYAQPPDEAIAALRRAGITTILNFRRDRVAVRDQYEVFAASLCLAGIEHRDACDSIGVSQQLTMHTLDLAARFMRSLRIPLMASPVAWLRPFVPGAQGLPRRDLRIGAYLGASVPTKRLPVDFWHSTLRSLPMATLHPVLIAGLSLDEISLLDNLSAALAMDGVSHSRSPAQSLMDLAHLIRGFDGLLTGDTFAAPLAEALGVPVVAIYCATDSRLYGVRHPANRSVQSSFYSMCPEKNLVGNCEGWTRGCVHLTCQRYLDAQLTANTAQIVFTPQPI